MVCWPFRMPGPTVHDVLENSKTGTVAPEFAKPGVLDLDSQGILLGVGILGKEVVHAPVLDLHAAHVGRR